MRVCCWRELMLCVLQVRNEFYKDSQGVILVYDVGLRESFDALDSWLTEMKQEMGSQANMENIIFIVCANKVPLVFKYLLWYLIYMCETVIKCGLWPIKVDLTKRRVVDESEGRLWAESRGFHYFETSAQSGEGINEMFQVSTRIHLFSFDYPAVLFFKEWLFFIYYVSTSTGLFLIHNWHVWKWREETHSRGQCRFY